MSNGEAICGSSGRKSLKTGVSGKGDERVEEGEGVGSSKESGGHGFLIFGRGCKRGSSEGDRDVTRQGIEGVVLNRVCAGME
jgi:hypothetical protein